MGDRKERPRRAVSSRRGEARLYRVILPVPDIAEAARFYARVLRAPGERVSEGRHYFDCGGTILALYIPREDGDPVGRGWRFHASQCVYLAVPDLAATSRRVRRAGGVVEGPIATMPWGERMFWARDPFGSPISFVDERSVFKGWKDAR